MELRSIRVDKNLIGYIKWLLESHDGMATPTTREGTEDVLDMLVSPGFEEEFEEFVEALAEEMPVEVVDTPASPPLGA
jgi:hypothetical protein